MEDFASVIVRIKTPLKQLVFSRPMSLRLETALLLPQIFWGAHILADAGCRLSLRPSLEHLLRANLEVKLTFDCCVGFHRFLCPGKIRSLPPNVFRLKASLRVMGRASRFTLPPHPPLSQHLSSLFSAPRHSFTPTLISCSLNEQIEP